MSQKFSELTRFSMQIKNGPEFVSKREKRMRKSKEGVKCINAFLFIICRYYKQQKGSAVKLFKTGPNVCKIGGKMTQKQDITKELNFLLKKNSEDFKRPVL